MEAFKQRGVDWKKLQEEIFMSWRSAIVDKGGERRGKADPCSHFFLVCRLLDEKDSSDILRCSAFVERQGGRRRSVRV